MRRGGSPYNALSEGWSLGRHRRRTRAWGQYRDGDAGGDRGTARQTAGSGAQGSRARGQEGAAGRGCGCEGRSRGTGVQKGFGLPAVVLQVDPQSAAERAGLKLGDLVTELDGTPVRDAADLRPQAGAAADRRSPPV